MSYGGIGLLSLAVNIIQSIGSGILDIKGEVEAKRTKEPWINDPDRVFYIDRHGKKRYDAYNGHECDYEGNGEGMCFFVDKTRQKPIRNETLRKIKACEPYYKKYAEEHNLKWYPIQPKIEMFKYNRQFKMIGNDLDEFIPMMMHYTPIFYNKEKNIGIVDDEKLYIDYYQYNCIKDESIQKMQDFVNDCLSYTPEIFKPTGDLTYNGCLLSRRCTEEEERIFDGDKEVDEKMVQDGYVSDGYLSWKGKTKSLYVKRGQITV